MTKDRYHFIGIGGIGMSGLARIALERGHIVSGSDAAVSSLTKELVNRGATVFVGHSASQVPLEAKIVSTSDIKETNVEYLEAKHRGLPCLHRSQMLHELMKESKALLVAGTHGKTTTSSLLAHVLIFAKKDPSYCIGGVVRSLSSQSGHGNGDLFVAEADESDGSFLTYTPYGAIITNIDTDHMDYWQTEEKLIQGFVNFQSKIEKKELFFWCADDSRLVDLSLEGYGYGFSKQAALRIEKFYFKEWESSFSVSWKGRFYEDILIPLVGVHNILNATAVFGLCMQIGIEERVIRQAFSSFQGAGRRSEKKGEVANIVVYDDYGHHPTEVATTLSGMKAAASGRRLVVLFQPHRYTRTKDCFSLFGPALAEADLILLTDIYAAREIPIEGINSCALQREMHLQGYESIYLPRENVVEDTLALLQPGDFVVTMGAGDVTEVGPELLRRLARCE